MTVRFRETYQLDDGLEQAVIDLVRVGSSGHASGVRQLANRLVRNVPSGVGDPGSFRAALQEAIATVQPASLRFGAGELPTDQGSSDSLVSVEPSPGGSGLVLEGTAMDELREVVEERRRAQELAAAGVPRTRTLLLSGPPGVGKSMAAKWLAHEIGVPLVAVNLATVVSSYLGSSGRNIRAVLEYAKSGQCVMLLDEFDAIAKRRNDESDIGELKRIVNVILLELDRWSDENLLVAATNHLQLLDEAVDRRFDRHIKFGLPGERERLAILEHLAAGTDAERDDAVALIAEMTNGWSGSDLTRLWELGMRRAVLNGTAPGEQLLRTFAQQVGGQRRDRDRFWLALSERLDLSSRQIASLTGVSHPTVSAGLKRARGASN